MKIIQILKEIFKNDITYIYCFYNELLKIEKEKKEKIIMKNN